MHNLTGIIGVVDLEADLRSDPNVGGRSGLDGDTVDPEIKGCFIQKGLNRGTTAVRGGGARAR
jgi:hypothetical protein